MVYNNTMSLRRSLKLELLLNQIALGFVGFNVAIAPHSQRSSWNKLYRAMRANSRSTQYRLRSRIRQLEHGGIIELWEHEYRLTAPVSYTHLTLPTNREV